VIARVRDLFRYEVVLRAPRDGSAQRVAQQMARARRLRPRTARLTIDVDPIDVL
jgi:primosomal protein N'